MIGIGLDSEKDITVRGLEAVRESDFVYLEDYTSRLSVTKDALETLYGKHIIPAGRDMIESKSDDILDKAVKSKVSLLIIGDVFSATTHADIFLRAREKGIEVKVIHNASIMTAVGATGLELYKFGRTVSLPYFQRSFEPDSWYRFIKSNRDMGMHTLLLLDIRKDEGRFMSIGEAIAQIRLIESRRKEGLFSDQLKIVGCARIGSDTQKIQFGTMAELEKTEFGPPLHCMIIPGKLHFIEEHMLGQFS